MNVGIEKRKGIDCLVREYSPGKVEKEKEIPEHDNKLSKLLKVYLALVDMEEGNSIDLDVSLWWLEKREEILSPDEIGSFLQLTSGGNRRLRNSFINELIKDSFDEGYNDFYLSSDDLPSLHHLRVSRPSLRILLNGNMNEGFRSSCYVDATIEWSVIGMLGDISEDCNYTLFGQLAENFSSENTQRNTYKTSNQDSLQKLIKNIPKSHYEERGWRSNWQPSENKIMFVHEDGEEELMRDYSNRSLGYFWEVVTQELYALGVRIRYLFRWKRQ